MNSSTDTHVIDSSPLNKFTNLNIKPKNDRNITNEELCVALNSFISEKNDVNKTQVCTFYRDSNDYDSNGKIDKDGIASQNNNVNKSLSSEVNSLIEDGPLVEMNKCYEQPFYNIQKGFQFEIAGDKMRDEGRYPEAIIYYKGAKSFNNIKAIYKLAEIYEKVDKNDEKALKNYNIANEKIVQLAQVQPNEDKKLRYS